MSINQNIDWEKRRYEMASTLFFQDIKTTDIHGFPYSRTGEWDRFVRCAASDAVMATDIFFVNNPSFPKPTVSKGRRWLSGHDLFRIMEIRSFVGL